MSRSNPREGALADLVDRLDALEGFLLDETGRACDDLNIQFCARLLGAATRLFTAAGNADALVNDEPLPSLGLTPTDAVVVAAALLRDQDLTPFDLALWFQRVVCEAKESNSFNVAVARAKEQFAGRLAEAERILA
jgi:hypothetical protein